MKQLSQIRAKAASRNDEGVFYSPPASLGEALLADIRDARKAYSGVNETIGALCDVEPKTVYSWERSNHNWTEQQIKATVMATGGRRTLAYLRQIAGASPVVAMEDHYELLEDLAVAQKTLAEMVEHATRDLSPRDDTPNEFDRDERRRLLSEIERLQAQFVELRTKLEEAC